MNRMKELRRAHGLTQKQVAAYMHTSQQTLARWEAGEGEPNIAALVSMAAYYATSVDNLLGTSRSGILHAKAAINAVFSDTSVSREETRESLRDLRDEIDILLDALKGK